MPGRLKILPADDCRLVHVAGFILRKDCSRNQAVGIFGATKVARFVNEPSTLKTVGIQEGVNRSRSLGSKLTYKIDAEVLSNLSDFVLRWQSLLSSVSDNSTKYNSGSVQYRLEIRPLFTCYY
jgi:hypothetical protein